MQRKQLPIGIQTFREIRENGHDDVDKTPFAPRLIQQGKPYFLSRRWSRYTGYHKPSRTRVPGSRT